MPSFRASGSASSAQPQDAPFPPLLRLPRPFRATRDHGSHSTLAHAALAGVARAGTLWNRPKRALRGRSHRDLGTRRLGDAAITVQTASRPPGRPAPLSGGRRSARRRRRPLTGHPTPEPSPETRARGGARAEPQATGPILTGCSLPDSGRSQWAGRVAPPALPPGPRPPRYTMAPEEGPLVRVPLGGELVGKWA